MRICYLGDVNIQVRLVSAHFQQGGHEVHICTFRPGMAPGCSVHPLLDRPLRTKLQYLTALPRLRKLLADIQPDVVHAFYVTSYGLLGSITAPDKLVLNAMGSDILIGPDETHWRRWLVRRAIARSRVVLSVAPHLSDALVRYGAPPSKLHTFPRGVDTNCFRPGDLPVADRAPTVVCIRKLEPLYNHRVLLEAAPRVLAANPKVRFVLCGDGMLKPELMRRTEELGVAAAFSFLGDQPHDTLPRLLREASIYFSGAISDGTSVSLLEAMAAGAYPIVADIPANRAWVPQGRGGSLFPAHDASALAGAILAALSDPEARTAAAELNRRQVVERASWTEGMRRLEGVYRVVAGSAVDA
jgi:glycosyltransferase involved in cell wall biosynthesis